MSDEEGTEKIVFIMERSDETVAFEDGLKKLLEETRELGPVVHLCLMSQLMGSICFHNIPDAIDLMKQNVMFNFDAGLQGAMISLVEQSQEGTIN